MTSESYHVLVTLQSLLHAFKNQERIANSGKLASVQDFVAMLCLLHHRARTLLLKRASCKHILAAIKMAAAV